MCKIPVLFILMEEKKVTQKALADAIGVSQGNISDWKSGRSSPSSDVLAKIAQFFNVPMDYILGNDDNSAEDTVKTYLFGTTNVDDDIFNQVKQYAKFIYQEKTSARIAASGGGKISVSSSKKTKEELDRLEIVQNSRKEADEIKKKLKK